MLRLQVPDMNCGNCAGRVTRAIHSVDAAATVRPDVAARAVAIETTATEESIRAALAHAGYPPLAA